MFAVAGALLGGAAISCFSSNRHDRSVEAAMTGVFVCGPLAGLAGAIFGATRRRRGDPPA